MVVFDSKTSPGNNSVDGKLASSGEFGKCWVSKHIPEFFLCLKPRLFPVYTCIPGSSV